MLRDIQEIQGLATKYSKAELGRMVQMGLLDPQKAMMAGMMIQRIEQQNAQPPQTTVAQDVLGMPPVANQAPQPQAPQGQAPMPPQQAPQAAPQAQPPMPQQGMAMGGGVEELPAGDVGNYAGGGIVAFGEGGDTEEKKYKYGKMEALARSAAEKYGVDPDKFARLIETESHYKPGAVSYAGKDAGLGIAQISKHHKLTDAQRLDPKFSLDYAAKMFSGLVDKAGGDYRKALEKYKGVVTDKGRRRMEAHIAQVLGEPAKEYPRLASAAPKTPRRARPADMGLPTLANAYMEREVPDRMQTAIPEYAQAQAAPVGGLNQLAMLSAPYTQQQGGDTSEYEMPEELQGGYAGGGVVALAQGGVPRFDEGGWLGTNSPEYAQGSNTTYGQQMSNVGQFFGDLFRKIVSDPSLDARQRAAAVKDLQEKAAASGITQEQINTFMGANRQLNQLLPGIAPGAGGGSPFATPEAKAKADNTRKLPDIDSSAVGEGGPSAGTGAKASGSYALKMPERKEYNVDIPVETAEIPIAKDASDFTKERTERYKAEDYDPKMYETMMANLEERKGSAATEKDKAVGEAIMMAGFKLMGARRGQEFQALSEGAQEGMKGYQSAMKEFKARQDKLDERIDAYRIADSTAKRTGADTDIANAQKYADSVQRAKEKAAEARNTAAVYAARITADMSNTDQQVMANILGHQISSDATRYAADKHAAAARISPEIQLIDRMRTDPEFAKAAKELWQMKNDPKLESQLRVKYAGDYMLQQQYPDINDYLRDMGVTPTGGGTGSLTPPKVGEIKAGYKYKGGDPRQESSWEKVK